MTKDQRCAEPLMLNGSSLSNIEEAGIAVLTLTEGLAKDEFLSSRLTRAETRRQVKIMCENVAKLSPQTRTLFAEVDWGAWRLAARQLDEQQKAEQGALWFAVRSLVPDTLMWLRVYRHNQPELFACPPIADTGEARP
jgi:uncharacterized protein with HEPN domain